MFKDFMGQGCKNITIFLTPKTAPKNGQEWNDLEWSEMIRLGQE